MKVICDPYYLKLIIVLSLAEIGCNINYTGTNYALDLVGWEYGINCIITGGIEFIAYLFLRNTLSMQKSSSLDSLEGKPY
jgi:hypothetical protein